MGFRILLRFMYGDQYRVPAYLGKDGGVGDLEIYLLNIWVIILYINIPFEHI